MKRRGVQREVRLSARIEVVLGDTKACGHDLRGDAAAGGHKLKRDA